MKSTAMRWTSGILFVLIVTGWAAYHLDESGSLADNQTVHTIWRHTASGWEKLSSVATASLHPSAVLDVWKTHPHPVIVALLVGLLSLTALVAFSPNKRHQAKLSPYHKVIPTTGALELRSRGWMEKAPEPTAQPVAVSEVPSENCG